MILVIQMVTKMRARPLWVYMGDVTSKENG